MPLTTPTSARPSPRRWGGISETVSAPPATQVIAKPTPRIMHAIMISVMFAETASASAGSPSPSKPAARVSRAPYLAMSRGVTRYAATADRVSALVVSPAVPVLAPADLAYRGTAESSR